MLSFTKIVKDSYRITVQNRILWLFGLFVFGGANVNFLYFQDIPLRDLQNRLTLGEVLVFFQNHPGWLALISSSLLVGALGLFFLTNWCRIVLIKSTHSLINTSRPEVKKQLKESLRPFWSVIAVSVLTTLLMLVVSAGLLGTPFWLVQNTVYRTMLWVVGVGFLVPLTFTISSVNIFTVFYVVLFKLGWKKSLNLGTDFFVTNWAQILGLSAILMVIYTACFAAGVALSSLVEAALKLAGVFGNFPISGIIWIGRIITGVFLWGLLAGLNVFFNTALLMLFLQLITPLDDSKAAPEKLVPASAAQA